jgi:hypothetical protein
VGEGAGFNCPPSASQTVSGHFRGRTKRQLMQSDKLYYRLFKYGLLFVGLLILVLALTSWFITDSMTINGEKGTRDIFVTSILGLFGLVFILTFIAIKDKFAVVKLGNQTIQIEHRGQDVVVNWLDVESISQIQFVHPPLYKIKTRGNESILWFNTEPKYFNIAGFVTDISDMGEFIKKKKKELGI